MNKKLKMFIIAGARPNFMKIAPLLRAIDIYPGKLCPIIVHTGQHYDFNMSDSFFIDLKIPRPQYFLGVGSGSHAEQTAKIMTEFERVLLKDFRHIAGAVVRQAFLHPFLVFRFELFQVYRHDHSFLWISDAYRINKSDRQNRLWLLYYTII